MKLPQSLFRALAFSLLLHGFIFFPEHSDGGKFGNPTGPTALSARVSLPVDSIRPAKPSAKVRQEQMPISGHRHGNKSKNVPARQAGLPRDGDTLADTVDLGRSVLSYRLAIARYARIALQGSLELAQSDWVVLLRVDIDPRTNLAGVVLVKSSGHAFLDQAVKVAIEHAVSITPPPSGLYGIGRGISIEVSNSSAS